MTTIVIGTDGSKQADAALRFGGALARAMEARVVVGTSYSHSPPLRGDVGGYEWFQRTDAAETAQRGAAALADIDDVHARVTAGATVADGLHRLAEAEHADLLVVATSSRRRIAGHQPGSVSEHVVHHSPCPVAVVPPDHPLPRFSRIGIAVDQTPAARMALSFAVDLARRAHAESPRFRLLHVSEPASLLQHVPQPGSTGSFEQAPYSQVLEELAAETASYGTVDVLEQTGDPSDELVRMSEGLDLLVCGSRDRGTIKRLLLGSVSTHLVRHAITPLIVVPGPVSTRDDAGAASQHATA